MDKKTVSKILNGKHRDFLKSIKDEKVRKLIDKNSIITGGSIVSLLMGEQVNDFDYYFTNLETCKAVAEYFIKEFNSLHPDKKIQPMVEVQTMTLDFKEKLATPRIRIKIQSQGITGEAETDPYKYFEQCPDEQGQDFVEQVVSVVEKADECSLEPLEKEVKEKYQPIFLSSNAITLRDKVQLIIRFYGDPGEIHKNYDFVHTINYWLSGENKLVLNQAALESILAKRLYYVGSLYPLSSIIRTRKFIQRGWKINAGQYLKMIFQCGELDLTNINVLEDQLVGVDCAYFFQVIDYCKKKQEEDPKFVVTAPYLISIIDKIF